MENAKDTFYIALRDRLNALNPSRMVLLRGVRRPGILVEANESPMAHAPADVFVLRWTGMIVDVEHAMPQAQQVCEITYVTEGTAAKGGLDRGQALAEMDRELLTILLPANTPKLNYSQTPAAALVTRVFWGTPAFSDVITVRDGVSRTVKVTVCSYEEVEEQ